MNCDNFVSIAPILGNGIAGIIWMMVSALLLYTVYCAASLVWTLGKLVVKMHKEAKKGVSDAK